MIRKNSHVKITNRSDTKSHDTITSEEANWMAMNWGRCPDCGQRLLGGPKDRNSQNVLCEDCSSEYNICSMTMGLTNRLGKASDDRKIFYGAAK